MKINAKADNRFQDDPSKFAAYLETPEGRLRLDLAFANLEEFQPAQATALDLGCGTGAMAIRLARLGVHVTALDSSPAMLDIARRTALDAGVDSRVKLQHGDVTESANLFIPGSFDVILCHNLLEYVEDPSAVLRVAARLLRGTSAILSILVRNQAGEVLKAALLNGDLSAAGKNLSAASAQESLYGGDARLFTCDAMEKLLRQASLTVAAGRGVRVIADYLPPQISRVSEYDRIFALERQLGSRPEFFAVARYTQWLSRLVTSESRSGE
jgi:S-adenosylmethionine-dependent methyltransferase